MGKCNLCQRKKFFSRCFIVLCLPAEMWNKRKSMENYCSILLFIVLVEILSDFWLNFSFVLQLISLLSSLVRFFLISKPSLYPHTKA